MHCFLRTNALTRRNDCIVFIRILKFYKISNDDTKSTQKNNEISNNTEDSEKNNVAKVGETLERGGIQFTFESITKYIDNSDFVFDKPDDGKEFILLWFSVKNTTNEDYYVNMFYEDSYCDDIAVKSTLILVNVAGDTLWGDVANGKIRKGYVAYQLPLDWQTIEFQYKPVFSGQESKLIFKAIPEDIK